MRKSCNPRVRAAPLGPIFPCRKFSVRRPRLLARPSSQATTPRYTDCRCATRRVASDGIRNQYKSLQRFRALSELPRWDQLSSSRFSICGIGDSRSATRSGRRPPARACGRAANTESQTAPPMFGGRERRSTLPTQRYPPLLTSQRPTSRRRRRRRFGAVALST